jgi:hypothetical protein
VDERVLTHQQDGQTPVREPARPRPY